MGKIGIAIIVFMLIVLSACAHQDVSVCRHNAVNAAILHKSENPQDKVRICLGWVQDKMVWHAQAKYQKLGGDWVFLQQPPGFTNWESPQDNFEIMKEFSIEEWLKDYLRVY